MQICTDSRTEIGPMVSRIPFVFDLNCPARGASRSPQNVLGDPLDFFMASSSHVNCQPFSSSYQRWTGTDKPNSLPPGSITVGIEQIIVSDIRDSRYQHPHPASRAVHDAGRDVDQ